MRLPTTPVTSLQRSLRDLARQHHRAGRVILAVDGVDGSGAAAFADGLAETFAEDGAAVYRASMDGFRRPRAERGAAGASARDAYDDATFRRVLVDPFRTGGSAGFQLTAFDADRDIPVESQWVTAPRDAVLIVDGAFLHRRGLRELWNWSVWLEVSPAVAASRVAARDGAAAPDGAEATSPAREEESRYVREDRPRAVASAIVENSDAAHPVQIFGDYC